jgi:hypothetical protein
MTSEQIKAVIASYWRYVKQCPVIALEANSDLSSYSGAEMADVLAVNKNRFLIETEVKISLADLKRDAGKSKHRHFREGWFKYPTHHFYFATPKDIANAAKLICDDLFPYAGVLGTDGLNELGVIVYRNPKQLARKKLTYPQILRLIFSQSGTVCRLSRKVDDLLRVQKNLSDQLKEYRDREKLEGGKYGTES